jgi:CRP-like cAMP-binding protein
VLHGAIQLRSTRDQEPNAGAVVRGGSLIGESALIIDTLRPAAAIAVEPTALLRVPRNVFLRTLEGEPAAAKSLRDMMASRLTSTLHDLDIVAPLFEAPADADEEHAKN